MIAEVTFEDYREEWLAEVREGSPSTTELGRRFAHKLLTQWLNIGNVSDDIVYCDGAGDGGIDVAYLDRGEEAEGDVEDAVESHIWYLVQSKYGKAFHGSNTLLSESQKVIETLDGRRHRLSSLSENLVERLRNFRQQASERDRLVLVFLTEEPLSEEQKRVLNDVRNMGQGRLGQIFDVDSVSVETIFLRTLEDAAVEAQPRLKVSMKARLATSGKDLLVGAVPLLNLYAFLKRYRAKTQDPDRLYEKNVRLFLGNRRKVNKSMQATLQEQPERFGLYNNGITVVVEDFKRQSNGEVELVEPYVVNGCQTTRTVWEVCHQLLGAGGTGTDEALENWREKAKRGVVITKVVKVGTTEEGLLQNITRYTNSQNVVREKDFLALTHGFRTWASQMAERYKVYLEIQRGGWDSRRAFQKQNPSATPRFTESANAFDLLKVYGAGWLGEAGLAYGKNAPFLPDGRIFRRLMNDDLGGGLFDVDDLWGAYLLQRAANEYNFGRNAKLARRQTRFLFYMIVMELLKDVLIHAGNPDPQPKHLTQALSKLSLPNNGDARRELLDTAIQAVDDYMTEGSEDTVYNEPVYKSRFDNNLGSYLKWEQLGKSKDMTPHLYALIALSGKLLGKRTGGQASPRDMVIEAISD